MRDRAKEVSAMRLLVAGVLLCLSLTLFLPFRVAGEAGVISGVVVDSVGRPVAGALVTLRTSLRALRSTTTTATGEFRFEAVENGTYIVDASKNGLMMRTATVIVGASAAPPVRLVLLPGPVTPHAETRPSVVDFLNSARSAEAPAPMALAAAPAPTMMGAPSYNTEAYGKIDEHRFHRTSNDPLSTFSIDVDTASYANVRRFLNRGQRPPADAVRIEELLNYFRYGYPAPANDEPFSVTTEVSECPWNPAHRLALIGLQTRPLPAERTPPRNLVFLLDVSGSMSTPDKLPLVKTAMRMLADTLRADDRVAIVVYAGSSGIALASTPGDRKTDIQKAIADLEANGSTNGAEGIRLAYDVAAQFFIKGGINRVILATDGDFNVGVTSQGELVRLIEEQRTKGVFLSVLGVGSGNLKDSTMEMLADRGNGNYAYLDSPHEARRVLVAEAGATLVTVAKDVKIQVEFNPRQVGAYKLIGYENRVLAHQDFNDDAKDAGEMGAGHSVTALYEIIPAGQPIEAGLVDPLKYQEPLKPSSAAGSNELMTVKVRYQEPEGSKSRLMTMSVENRVEPLTPNLGFASAVAEFALLLRESEHKGRANWGSAMERARRFRGDDPDGYRAELIRLIELAGALGESH
jgi:Ca-activated chloride channel homolog